VERVDGWMDRWIDGRMEGWRDGEMEGRMDGGIVGWCGIFGGNTERCPQN